MENDTRIHGNTDVLKHGSTDTRKHGSTHTRATLYIPTEIDEMIEIRAVRTKSNKKVITEKLLRGGIKQEADMKRIMNELSMPLDKLVEKCRLEIAEEELEKMRID
jgi:hypothetical protein